MNKDKSETNNYGSTVIQDAGHKNASNKRPIDSAISHSLENVNEIYDANSSPKTDTNSLLKHNNCDNGMMLASGSGASSKEHGPKSTKEEKQRQNEEIVIMESSSLSSETGSWESVFPPKIYGIPNPQPELKVASCFIDAAALVDDDIIQNSKTSVDLQQISTAAASKPVACMNKERSENGSEDSLDQSDASDEQDSKKDLSSAIFEMTPVTEDSLNTFDNIVEFSEHNNSAVCTETEPQKGLPSKYELCTQDEPIVSQKFTVDRTPPTRSGYVKPQPCCTSAPYIGSIEPSSLHPSYDLNYGDTSQQKSWDDGVRYRANQIKSLPSIPMSSFGENTQIVNLDDKLVPDSDNVSIISSHSTMSSRTTELSQIDWERNNEMGIKTEYSEELHTKQRRYSESSPILSGGVSVDDYLPSTGSNVSSPMLRRRTEEIPIVSGVNIPETPKLGRKSPRQSTSSAWFVEMSGSSSINEHETTVSKPVDKGLKNVMQNSTSSSNQEPSKSRSSVDSETSEKSAHTYFIDITKLPDPFPSKTEDVKGQSLEKKMFSMYIDLGNHSTVKQMPSRLVSMNTKKQSDHNTPKPNPKISNLTKKQPEEKIKDTNHRNLGFKTNSTSTSVPIETNADTNMNGEKLRNSYSELTTAKVNIDNKIRKTNGENNLSINACSGTMGMLLNMKQHREKCSKKEIYNTSSTNEHKTFTSNNLSCNSKSTVSRSMCLRSRSDVAVIPLQLCNKEDACDDIFVKLSDLDRTTPKIQLDSITEICDTEVPPLRMTRSIPESTWADNNKRIYKSTEIMHSFHSENALSLNRLFPHLKDFSNSISSSLTSRTLSPLRAKSLTIGENDEMVLSDGSDMSMQSSNCRSGVENSSTDETSQMSSLIGNCQSKLGQDLLRMFLEEIAPDVVVEASGRRVKAHKCILSSRCQYFAGILSGGWVESAGNVIVLPTFSYSAVHFALCHIYSGISTIPDSINILELATIADMLGLDGLKEAIMYHLKVKYCHNFHKPCAVCSLGVLECFPLSSAYGLDDLYRKCLKWITKHYCKIWITKSFATLPKELLEKCFQEHVISLEIDNVIDTVCGCGLILEALPEARWAETVARLCRRLVCAAAQCAAPSLRRVLGELAAGPPAASCAARRCLHDCISAAIEYTPPDETCRVYEFLSELTKEIEPMRASHRIDDESHDLARNTFFGVYASGWLTRCESVLVRSAPKAVSTRAFQDLSPELRKRLRELGCIAFEPRPKSASSSLPPDRRNIRMNDTNAGRSSPSRSTKIDNVRKSFVPYHQKPKVQMRSESVREHDPLKNKHRPLSDPPKIRTTKAQQQRTFFNLSLCYSRETSESAPTSRQRTKTKYEKTRPRYLEPKRCLDTEKKTISNKLHQKFPSSSDSSRNTSPIQAAVLKNRRMKAEIITSAPLQKESTGNRSQSQPVSEDSLAPTTRANSTEPATGPHRRVLDENAHSRGICRTQYDTYTKKKHNLVKSYSNCGNKRSERFCKVSTPDRSFKTKIPVYVNSGSHPCQELAVTDRDSPRQKLVTSAVKDNRSSKARARSASATLMSATKSSSAKMVIKVVDTKNIDKASAKIRGHMKKESPNKEIPLMERSGTFVKEESSFSEQTTKIDVL